MTYSTKPLHARIDELFQADEISQDHHLDWYVNSLHANCVEAEKGVRRGSVTLVIGWIVLWAIAGDLVHEGSISSFQVTNLKYLLFFGPPIIGALSYRLISSSIAVAIYESALIRCIKNRLPKVYELDLEEFTLPPTIINLERVSSTGAIPRWLRIVQSLWLLMLGYLAAFGTLAAIVHISYLMYGSSTIDPAIKILSIVVAGILWLKAILLHYSFTSSISE